MYRIAIAITLAALALAGCSAPTDPAASPSSSGSSAAAAADAPTEGVLEVPGDIRPGTYTAVVPRDSVGCYWARLKGTSGQLEDIISNGLVQPGARVVVTIKSTDKALDTHGCGPLKLKRKS